MLLMILYEFAANMRTPRLYRCLFADQSKIDNP